MGVRRLLFDPTKKPLLHNVGTKAEHARLRPISETLVCLL